MKIESAKGDKIMKNIKLIPGFLCLVFALAACSGQNKKVTTGEDGLKYSSDQILDPSLFKTDYELDVNVNPTDPEYKVVSNQKLQTLQNSQ